ncbi:hypothetical protein SSPIM334S_05580 [Streptomyces spiroverticillatus]|uniref:hypothetical protein n=1 Tax=Streptomyces finlayi TaxID=67296 RepID=UPI0016790FBC|nr:hypothetical protein [Streptomyces finlayi]
MWRTAGPRYPDTPDVLTSEGQLLRALHTYTAMSARLLAPSVPRFRMTVRTLVTRELVGLYEWERSTETGRLVPAHTPFVHWPELVSVAA